MKVSIKQLILAAVAGASIVFATGCATNASRPVLTDTISDGGSSASGAAYTVQAAPSVQATPASGVAGAAEAQPFGLNPQAIFGASASAANAAADANAGALVARTDGGTLVGNEIRGITALQPVFFDFDRYAIKETERAKIQALKDYLVKNPTQRVLIEGHCDWRGTAEYNMALGDRRANAVRRYAIQIGIPVGKIQTKSLGSTQAIEHGTEAEMAKDRRGEIVILVK